MEAAIISGGDRAITLASAATKTTTSSLFGPQLQEALLFLQLTMVLLPTFASSAVVSDLVQLTGVDSSVSGTLVAQLRPRLIFRSNPKGLA